MIIYLFRHGIALDIGSQGISSDEERKLSGKGKEKTKEIAQGLKNIKCRPKKIISSPLTRAKQTADIAADILTPKTKVEVIDELAPGHPLKKTVKWLNGQEEGEIMLVGHNPDMEMLASLLVTGAETSDIRLKKASICRIVFCGKPEPGTGRLEWLMQPAQLVKLKSHH